MLAEREGLAGTVIDGVHRDTQLCIDVGYPIFGRNHWMRTGKDRVQVDAEQVPVTIGQVRVKPGDLLRGDADGVVVIPHSREAEVLSIAESINEVEERIRALVESGMSLKDAREKMGYHKLQSRKE